MYGGFWNTGNAGNAEGLAGYIPGSMGTDLSGYRKNKLLWMLGEIGEVIDIVKKTEDKGLLKSAI